MARHPHRLNKEKVMTEAVDLNPLNDLLAGLPANPSDVIPILQRAQAIYGYLPPEALQRVSEHLNISLGKIFGVATFYAQFYLERRGRHVLKICDGTACHVKGAPALVNAVAGEYKVEAGATTDDGQLTMEIVYCLGSCALAPVAVVDGNVMGRLGEDTLLRQVKKHLIPAIDAAEARA
jgi:NADH-quinone oxidoreductase subunit E